MSLNEFCINLILAVICNLCPLGNYCHLCSFAGVETAASTRKPQKDPVVRAELKDCIAETNATAAQIKSTVKITQTRRCLSPGKKQPKNIWQRREMRDHIG